MRTIGWISTTEKIIGWRRHDKYGWLALVMDTRGRTVWSPRNA